jgi:hypothetical protein
VDLFVQATVFEKIAIGLGGGGKATWDRNPGTGQIADHLAQGRVFAAHSLNVVFAKLVEGNYVLFQGDLSADCRYCGCRKKPGGGTTALRTG